MSPRTRFIIAHPIRAHRFHRAATAAWPTTPTGDTMKLGRTHTQILDEMVEAGELTPQQAADDWHDSHADDREDDR